MARKLKPGVHWVNVGGKRRKVRVLASGKWRFMKSGKGTTGAKANRRRRASPKTRTHRKGGRKMARRRKRGRRKTRIPSVASIIVAANAANELGLVNAFQTMTGSDGTIADAIQELAQVDPLNIIDAIIPAVIIKFARRFTGPIQAGPIRIL